MSKKLCTLFAVASLAFTAWTVTFVTSSPSAGAYCITGGGNLQSVLYSPYGVQLAREAVAYSSTCDGDYYYAGQAYDPITDGSCAYVDYYYNGYSPIGWACTTGAWSGFSFGDYVGSSYGRTATSYYNSQSSECYQTSY